MRAYSDKKDVQKKAYYTDRYWVAPTVPREKVENDEVFAADLAAIEAKFTVLDSYIEVEQLVVIINPDDNFGVIKLMKEELQFEQLSEMAAIDWIARSNEFEIVVQMLSMAKRKRVRVKYTIAKDQAVESLNPLYRSADWAEREMYDMHGVIVNNHPYMKRILMPDDWQDHPLLKTYPLHGDEAAQWYEVDKIFGKEARDIIGPEIRDAAAIDRYDTERFSRLGHEVPYGADISNGEPDTPLAYQEDDGVFLIRKVHEDDSVTITDRDR